MHGNGVEPIKLIGQGGMGAVYKARQWNPQPLRGVESHAVEAADGGSINQRFHRFKREARLLARLSHRNVVTVYDFELAGDFLYFTMDFVDGRTLRQMLKIRAIESVSRLQTFSAIVRWIAARPSEWRHPSGH